MFEGSEDIALSNYEENMQSINGSSRSNKSDTNDKKDGPRLLVKDMMISPKKVGVTNKRQPI
jgi:hypothetical protein